MAGRAIQLYPGQTPVWDIAGDGSQGYCTLDSIVAGGGSGGGGAATIADGADVTEGAIADAAAAAGAVGTVSAKLRRLTTDISALLTALGTPAQAGGTVVLGAGSALAGKVGVDQTTPGTTNQVTNRDSYSAAATITRAANQTPYSIGDVVGGAFSLPSMGPSGGRIILTSAALELDISAIPSGMTTFRLALYNVTPPSAIADNSPFDLPSGDRASFLGIFSLGTPIDLGVTCYVETNGLGKQVKLAGTGLFGYLITDTAYTPAANSEVYLVTTHGVGC